MADDLMVQQITAPIIEQQPDINQDLEDSNFYLPDVENLITEDDTPVDNWGSEKQQRLLSEILYTNWKEKTFLVGANVGIYYQAKSPAIVPDVFISLDVEVPENFWEKKNRCYLMWEFAKPPELVIEIVSNKVGKELAEKMTIYQRMHINYYVVYDPEKHLGDEILRVYELQRGNFVQKSDNFLEQLELGLTFWSGEFENVNTSWLRWTDLQGHLLLTGKEMAHQAEHRADQAENRADQAERKAQILAEKLRELGINPDDLA
jgi:Uma2 family endonuclease